MAHHSYLFNSKGNSVRILIHADSKDEARELLKTVINGKYTVFDFPKCEQIH